jgi:hypothetical protein
VGTAWTDRALVAMRRMKKLVSAALEAAFPGARRRSAARAPIARRIRARLRVVAASWLPFAPRAR